MIRNILALILILSFAGCSPREQDSNPVDWHHPLYMSNNDYWRQRIPIRIHNRMDRDLMGDPLELQIGGGIRQAPLRGVLAEGLRVVTAEGVELCCRITDSKGNIVEKGPVPADGKIVIPVECKAGASVMHYVYFDNPSAWAVGDYYLTHREILNGGFDHTTIYGPLGWELSLPQSTSRVEYSPTEGYSSGPCIKIVASDEAHGDASGALQRNIHLLSGTTYSLECMAKGQDVAGAAELRLIFGNQDTEDFKLGEHVAKTESDGAFAWRKISAEFTVPAGASGAHLHLSLNGSGTVWFDDVRITPLYDYDVAFDVLQPERLSLAEAGSTADWIESHGRNVELWPSRSAVKSINLSSGDISEQLICVDVEGVLNRLYAETNEQSPIIVARGTSSLPFYRAGDYILFKQDLKASTVQTNYIYYAAAASKPQVGAGSAVASIDELQPNKLANPDFESDDLSAWRIYPDNGRAEFDAISCHGERSIRLHVADNTPQTLVLEQAMPVRPGATYFCSAYLKASDMLRQPDFLSGIQQRTLRAQFVDKDGTKIGARRQIAVNPEKYSDASWTQLYMLLEAPPGAEAMLLQLVNAAPGTVWFDDVICAEVFMGSTSPLALERFALRKVTELCVWQEDPIVKVFRDDLPPTDHPSQFGISMARNEVEPLQLVLRAPTAYSQLTIEVLAPADARGNRLEGIKVGVVGYVPINYPSNYITDRASPLSYWQQKIPVGRIGSDGWTGFWPDPILPFDHFDLAANSSQPLWIEVSAPENAVPGDYVGALRLMHQGNVLREIQYNVHVWNFSLPAESHLIAEYDARIKNWDFFGYDKSETERMKEIWKMLANHRLCPDIVTPSPTWTKTDGIVSFDFAEFDRSAEYYFNELKLHRVYSPWDFYLFGWANLPGEKFGEKPYPGDYPYPDADRSQLRPEFKKAYQSALKAWWDHLKGKGWADKAVLYISDEPHSDTEITAQMRALCSMIHEVDPTIPIYVSTWWYRPEYEGYVDVWGVSNHGGGWGRPVPAEDLAKIKRNGGRLWFTTDGKMCSDTPFLGFERLLPYFCFKYGAEEYEFWGSNWYTFNPFEYGWHAFIRQSDRPGDLYWIRYPNGDANFIYPGKPIGVDHLVPTIRLKLAREGVEDYEYLRLLEGLLSDSRATGSERSSAELALRNALAIVTIPSAEGRYSTEYLPDPYVVMQVRNQVGKAIESLSASLN
jgi:hypothetical protein